MTSEGPGLTPPTPAPTAPLPLGDSGLPLSAAVAAVEDWYRRRARLRWSSCPGRCKNARVPIPWKIYRPNEAGYPAPAPPSASATRTGTTTRLCR